MTHSTGMEANPQPFVKHGDSIEYEPVEAATGLSKAVLVGSEDGAPNFAMRRFRIEEGAQVPKHTNAVEHEQFVLEGEYTVGLGETERTVSAGDSLLIPAGTVHWYRNDSEQAGSFLCIVPHGDDEIELLE